MRKMNRQLRTRSTLELNQLINEPAKKRNLYVRYKIDVNKDGELRTNQLQQPKVVIK